MRLPISSTLSAVGANLFHYRCETRWHRQVSIVRTQTFTQLERNKHRHIITLPAKAGIACP
jgi:hypothetical protein